MSNDGKYLENEIEKRLKKNIYLNIHYRRLHDAGAARSKLAAQPADFFLANNGRCYHLECKSRGKKTFRLEKFDQHSDMVRWAKAGVCGIVLVHFHELDLFSVVDVATLPAGVPSWVLPRADALGSIDEAFEMIMNLL